MSNQPAADHGLHPSGATCLQAGAARRQAGAGLLGTVAALAAILVLTQGALYYRAKSGARLLASEKDKVLSQQLAEAGVENALADLGARRLHASAGMADSVLYANKALGNGSYSASLTTLALGTDADTVSLTSNGSVGRGSSRVQARLRLKKYLDTTLTPRSSVSKETTYIYSTRTVPDTSIAVKVRDPNTMPQLDKTAEYSACMSSSAKKCDICHLPGGDPAKADVISVSKSAINTHITHHGDYVTTDGTCDLYKPKPDTTVFMVTRADTTQSIIDHTTYDTLVSVDTLIRIRFLSWR